MEQVDILTPPTFKKSGVKSTWAPGKLDVTAGGHYQAGENTLDGLREVEEELGKIYSPRDLTFLGRKLNVSPDVKCRVRHNLVEIYFTTDNSPLETYQLEENEVYAIVTCPLDKLLATHKQNQSFQANGLNNQGKSLTIQVTQDSFPYNWDNYHYKIALLANRYLKGETDLVY
jgi:hypothetical protein